MSEKMNPKIKKRWCAALRSGQYEQATGQLKDGYGFCCLGVLTDLYIKENDKEWNELGLCSGLCSSDGELNGIVCAWAGLDDASPSAGEYELASMNDDGESFLKIADLIEQCL